MLREYRWKKKFILVYFYSKVGGKVTCPECYYYNTTILKYFRRLRKLL